MNFSILLDSNQLQLWQYESLAQLVKEGEASCVKIYLKKHKRSAPKANYKNIAFRLFMRLSHTAEKPTKDIRELFPNITVKKVDVVPKGRFKEEFPRDVIEELREQKLDFIIRFGFGILSGDILKVSKSGVWSFHHGDNNKFRGRPAGFWEMYHSEKTISGMLQVLSEKLDDGEIISTWNIKCHPYNYKKNLSGIKMAGKYELKKAVHHLKQNNKLPKINIESSKVKYPINRLPNNFQTFVFLLKRSTGFLKSNLQKFVEQNWKVLLFEEDGSKIIKELQVPKRLGFIADPFVVKMDNCYLVLVEFFDSRKKKGRIDYFILDQNFEILDEGVSLEETFHLSYPNVFEYHKEFYVIPEMAKSKRQTIYKLNSDGKLIKVKDIISNVSISDPTILHHDNKWWLFGSCNENELNIWYSDDPFQEWLAHPLNPVKVDVKASRPAGEIYFDENKLIRPTQDISNFYGERVHLNRIQKLSINEFSENHDKTIDTSSFNIKSNGIHTINSCEGVKIVDVMDYKIRRSR